MNNVISLDSYRRKKYHLSYEEDLIRRIDNMKACIIRINKLMWELKYGKGF